MLRKLFLACCGSGNSHNSSETHLDRTIKKKHSKIKRASVFLNSNSISILCKEGTLDHLNPASVSYAIPQGKFYVRIDNKSSKSASKLSVQIKVCKKQAFVSSTSLKEQDAILSDVVYNVYTERIIKSSSTETITFTTIHPENSLSITLNCIHVFASAHFCVQVFQELDFKDMTDFTVTPQLDSLTRKELFMEETPSTSVMDGAESFCGTVDCEIDTLDTPGTAATISTNGGGTGVYSTFRSSMEDFHHDHQQLQDSPSIKDQSTPSPTTATATFTQDSTTVSTSTTQETVSSTKERTNSIVNNTKERANSIVTTTSTVAEQVNRSQSGNLNDNINAMPAQTIVNNVNNTETAIAASAIPNANTNASESVTPSVAATTTDNTIEKDEPTVNTPLRNNVIPIIAVTPDDASIVSPQSINVNTDSLSALTPTREDRPRKHLSHRFKNNSEMRHFIRRAVGKTESIDIDNFHIDMRDQISADSESSSDEEFAECND